MLLGIVTLLDAWSKCVGVLTPAVRTQLVMMLRVPRPIC